MAMRYGHIPNVDKPVSRLVLGSMVFSTEKQQLTNALLDRFLEAGGNAVDTARVYTLGSSEVAFGNWLTSSGRRDQVVVIGKGAHHDRDTFERRVNPAAIHEDIQISLNSMQLDRMDVYILHKDDPNVPVGPIIEALNEEWEAGRIGAFGGSSWTQQRIAEANGYAEPRGLHRFDVSSPNLSLAVPNEPMWEGCISLSGDADALEWYAATQMPVLAWSSQARGFFSGRYTPGMTGETTNERNVVRTYFSDANWERYKRAEDLARKKGFTLQQITLAWVLHQPLNVYALIGPENVTELENSLGALDVELDADELAWLNLESAPTPAAPQPV